jgi:hypothetical protein
MGTTLTGTTPQDTYDSLIKVTDNGPLSGTLKALSDGLGNDSTLSLSTTAASIAGTLAVTGNAAFDTNVLFVDAASNEVGVGTASPQSIFHIGANAPANAGAKAYTGLANTAEGFLFDYYYDTTASNLRLFDVVPLGAATTGIGGSALRFLTVPQTTTNTPLERMRITAAGNVGIGTDAPLAKLDVRGTTYLTSTGGDGTLADAVIFGNSGFPNTQSNRIRTTTSSVAGLNGISLEAGNGTIGSYVNNQLLITGDGVVSLAQGQLKFPATQVSSADANTLDDYEEGTFDFGISFGGGSTGITYSHRTGTYTKIGRQVTVNGLLELSSKGSSTGSALLTGLPFAIGSGLSFFTAVSVSSIRNITFADVFSAYGNQGVTSITLGETTNAGAFTVLTNADFANNSELIVSLTYFV